MDERDRRLMDLLSEMKLRESKFNDFYYETKKCVMDFVHAHGITGQDADDVAIECYLAIHDACSRFRREAKPLTWVYKIVHHKCIDFYRRNRRKRFPEVDTMDPRDYAWSSILQLDLKRALTYLNKDEYNVFVYHACLGFKYRQIGKKLNRPPGTLKRQYHTAREKLQRALGSNDFD